MMNNYLSSHHRRVEIRRSALPIIIVMFMPSLAVCVDTPNQGPNLAPGPVGADHFSQIIPSAPEAGTAGAVLSLAQAESLLLDNNLAIAWAQYGVDAAKAGQIIAGYRPNPTLTMSAEQFNTAHPMFHLTSNDPTSLGYQHFYTVRVDQTIERGGKRGFRMLGAEKQLLSSEASLQDAIRQQLFQLRQSYFAAVQARESLDVAKDMLSITDQNESLVKAQIDAGAAAQADLLTFQINRLQFQQGLISAQQTYSQSLNDIIQVLNMTGKSSAMNMPAKAGIFAGVNLNGPEVLTLPDKLDPTLVSVSYDDISANAEMRADVVAARHAMDAAEVAIKGARALSRVDVSIGVEYQRNGGDDTVGIAVQVPLPLFNDHRGDVFQAEAQYRQSQVQYRQVLGQARTDISKAYKAYEGARQLLVLYSSETIDKAKEALRIATGAYKEGGIGLLEVFGAQQAYNSTKNGHIQAMFAYQMALFQLELATGKRVPR